MFIADLHIHSKYSRATSRDCVPEYLELWARRKGIDLIGTGDFTHPAWREELSQKLVPAEDGLYRLKEEYRLQEAGAPESACPRFVVSGEISSIYKKNGRVRKIHNLILLPGLEQAASLAAKLEEIGNLHSDGRPILGLDSRDLLEITLEVCPEAIFIPAHIWTPHFSLFGAFSGFDTIEECFEDLTPHIHALETGLSSDPPMNWRLSALDKYILVSNSDAHSPAKLGREANLLCGELSYSGLSRALNGSSQDFSGTIEFFPEEGKYHYDGHRNCKQCLTPAQAENFQGRCPVCGGKLTTGVLHRVEQLADREEGFLLPNGRPFESIVPLPEAVAASLGISSTCIKARKNYEALLREIGPEFFILRQAPLEDIRHVAGPCVEEGIRRMRQGKIHISPGYDGEFGKITLLDEKEIGILSGQISFFGSDMPEKKKKISSSAKPKGSTKKEENISASVIALNPEQQAAIDAKESTVAVIAGPGTGKTRTLIEKILHLLEDGVKPGQITAVTFTNKAAGEIRDRLSQAVGKRAAKAVNTGTFHQICQRLLSLHRPVTVLDPYEAQAIAKEIAKAEKCSAKKLLDAVSCYKNGSSYQEDLEKAITLYEERLKTYHVLDFDDLLLETLALFENGADKKEKKPFTYLLVDEFQDVNDLQYRLIQAWGRESTQIFVIGDPDQSIYGFRGTAPECFSRFEAENHGVQIPLIRNYRSSPEILSCALPVISQNPGGKRELKPSQPGGAAVRLMTSSDDFSEAVFIAKEINRMVGGIDMLGAQIAESRGFSDIAVLYRTHRQAEILEKCLAIEGIPYVVTGRNSFLSESSIRGTIAFFRQLLNPEDAVSQIVCSQTLPPVWQSFVGTYQKAILKEKPRSLLEHWISDMGFSGLSMERLLNMAVFQEDMGAFLQNLTFGEEQDIHRTGGKTYLSDAVHLMTFHGAKGLEFPVVFLCGLRQGLLPLEMPNRTVDIEEERRLFYVAMTRAKEELVLLTGTEPSIFLKDIPANTIKTGNTVEYKKAPEPKQLSLF
ncbi:hypothetical protein D7Y09_10475 [bacterium 1XD42-1]|nr:hypothetical protein D7X25_09290 [bacterium 1XD42-8]RKJ63833.1 hypothetical protein D7Y09_10475 [bacterium 1XD42-1]